MVFCPKERQDSHWVRLLAAADELGLPRLQSTTKRWSDLNPNKDGMVFAFCGPPSDKAACVSIGARIKSRLAYGGTLYYKKDTTDSTDPDSTFLYKI